MGRSALHFAARCVADSASRDCVSRYSLHGLVQHLVHDRQVSVDSPGEEGMLPIHYVCRCPLAYTISSGMLGRNLRSHLHPIASSTSCWKPGLQARRATTMGELRDSNLYFFLNPPDIPRCTTWPCGETCPCSTCSCPKDGSRRRWMPEISRLQA